MKRISKLALIIAILMVAFLPQVVRADDQTFNAIMTGIGLIAAIKDARSPATKPAAGSLFSATAQTGPVIVVTRFEGDYGELAQEEVVRVLAGLGYQSRAANGAKELNDTMDELRLENSEWGERGEGRNPIGEFSGAQFLIIGRCQEIGRGDNEARISSANGRLEELTVELTVKAYDVRTGKMAGQVMKASGTSRRLSNIEVRQNSSRWGNYLGAELSRRLYVDLSRRAIAKAAESALGNEMSVATQRAPVVRRTEMPSPKPIALVSGNVTFAFPSGRAFVIDLNPGKVVHTDDRIKYRPRPGQTDPLAQYRVRDIAGQTVLLEKEYGDQPELTDGFRIICAHSAQ